MEITIRKNDTYLDVQLNHGGIIIDLGLHDDKEQKELAQILLVAATELLEGAQR